jgi:hypothetical protein
MSTQELTTLLARGSEPDLRDARAYRSRQVSDGTRALACQARSSLPMRQSQPNKKRASRPVSNDTGAEDGIRTRDPLLGKDAIGGSPFSAQRARIVHDPLPGSPSRASWRLADVSARFACQATVSSSRPSKPSEAHRDVLVPHELPRLGHLVRQKTFRESRWSSDRGSRIPDRSQPGPGPFRRRRSPGRTSARGALPGPARSPRRDATRRVNRGNCETRVGKKGIAPVHSRVRRFILSKSPG